MEEITRQRKFKRILIDEMQEKPVTLLMQYDACEEVHGLDVYYSAEYALANAKWTARFLVPQGTSKDEALEALEKIKQVILGDDGIPFDFVPVHEPHRTVHADEAIPF